MHYLTSKQSFGECNVTNSLLAKARRKKIERFQFSIVVSINMHLEKKWLFLEVKHKLWGKIV